ncbi:type II toxin-antitoxin system RelE/ParE family toxin [Gemmobacter sp.]|uniref:type II toxin-antitoxin system RelE/ParE family toxin n=1 Tax=Gemmobacter sp. TaxID=1898957 RepID=UPI002AFEF64F|nr:type II toxin-antitoxin system RelE/ParE family toxin [Gemmobacter sp.]
MHRRCRTCRTRSTGSAVLALEWRSTAIADLLAIVDYVADDNSDAAQALKDEIETGVARWLQNPRHTQEAVRRRS